MISWLIWAMLLFLQNASHTATTRARASNDPWRTAWASIPSNGIWFASQFFIVNKMLEVKGEPLLFAITAVFYVTLTAAGSAAAHWWLLKRGK